MKKRTNKRFFKSPRLEIGRVLIEELESWESADKPTEEEFYRLTERLAKIILNPPRKNE